MLLKEKVLAAGNAAPATVGIDSQDEASVPRGVECETAGLVARRS